MNKKILWLGLSFLLVAALVLTGCPAPPEAEAVDPIPQPVEVEQPPIEPVEPEPVIEEPVPVEPAEPQEVQADLVWTVDELLSFYEKYGFGRAREQSEKLEGKILTVTGMLAEVTWYEVKLVPLCEFTFGKYSMSPDWRFIISLRGEIEIPGVEPFNKTSESLRALRERVGEVITFTGIYVGYGIAIPVRETP